MVVIGKTIQGLDTTIIENRIAGSMFYLQEEGVFFSISAIVEWIFDGTRIKAALYDDNGFVAETEEKVLTTDNTNTKTDVLTFVFPQTPTQEAGNIRLVLWSDRLANLFYDSVPNVSAGLSLNLPYGAFPATLVDAGLQQTEYTVYAEYTPTGVEPPIEDIEIPNPIVMSLPVIPGAELVYETDFQDAFFANPIHSRLGGMGELDGLATYINGLGGGGSFADLVESENGSKALKLSWLNPQANSDRAELHFLPYSATKNVSGKSFMYECLIMLHEDFVLTDPLNKWFIFNTVQDVKLNPKFQSMFIEPSPGQPNTQIADIAVDQWNYDSSENPIIGRYKDYVFPRGTWIKVSWLQVQHPTEGKIRLWINDVLMISIDHLKTIEHPDNPEGYYSIVPLKLYCRYLDYHPVPELRQLQAEWTPKIGYISDFKLYNVEGVIPTTNGQLQVRAYLDGNEVTASVEIVGVGTYDTPLSLSLGEGSYTLNASHNSHSESKTVDIIIDQTTNVSFNFITPPPPGKGTLDIHAYANGSEVGASIEIVEVGNFTTPLALEVDPAGYTINATYEDQPLQTKTVQVTEGLITTVEFQFEGPSTPPPPPPPAPLFPRLREKLYPIRPDPFDRFDERRGNGLIGSKGKRFKQRG